MKDSGIAWIGKIPEGWGTSRVGLHYDIVLGKMLCSEQATPQHTLGRYYCAANVHFGEISPEDELKEMWFSEAEKQSYGIKEGDLLVVEGGAGAGGCAIASRIQGEVYIQNSILRVRAKEGNDNRYLRYYIESMVKRNYIDIVCNKATIPHFTKDKLGAMPYIVMSLAEQQAIADFLDEKCAAFDKLIDNQKAQIEKMKEYKQSVITEAVTKGLNPSVPMKDSGIEWIGKIPEGWETCRLKNVADPLQENSFIDGDWIESPDITDEGIRYLTTGNVGDGLYKRQGNGYISQETFKDLNCKYAYPGDLVIARLNAPYGRSCILEDDEDSYVLAVDIVILRTLQDKRYICYFTQCPGYQRAVEDYSRGTAMKRISRNNLGNIDVLLPPLAEQQAIADYLDEKCAAIDKLIAIKQAKIDKLNDYKKSLIYEYVTGKREVL